MLVPDRATPGGPADHVAAEARDGVPVVALARGLVASERDAARVKAIQAQERSARAIRFFQQRLVDRHVLGAGTTGRLEEKLPGRTVGPSDRRTVPAPPHPTVRPSDCPALNLRRAHTLPPAGTHQPERAPLKRGTRGPPADTPY